MLKGINWKRILFSFIWLFCLGGLVVLMSFIEVEKGEVRCKEVKVIIPGTISFIEKSEIDRILLNTQGPIEGRLLKKINVHDIELALLANPFIEDARVYTEMDGTITVQIKQREPVLRVLNLVNQDFYIDRNGLKIPTSQNFTARVLVANGHIMEGFSGRVDTLKSKVIKDLFKAAQFIEKDTLWNEQIEQLYVNEQKEIEMVPRVGDHKIILGNADSLSLKFKNLLNFYKKALPKVGWDAYKTINIKYYNQVVCERADTLENVKVTAKKSAPALAMAADSIKGIQDTNKTVTH